jgi:hypothetical protein
MGDIALFLPVDCVNNVLSLSCHVVVERCDC